MLVAIADLFKTLLQVKMDNKQKTIIDKHMRALLSDMNAFDVAISLQSKHLFSDHDFDTIRVIFLYYLSVGNN